MGKKKKVSVNNAHPTEDFRGLTIYQVMLGSFMHSGNGAKGYSQMWGLDNETKNGNIRGIIEAMPHIASLGVNVIWLTPIFDSRGAKGGEKLQAPCYFAKDYFSIDPILGTEDDLHELIGKAHEMDIYVFLE